MGAGLFVKLAAPFVSVWSHLKEVMGLRDPSDLTLEDFRVELAQLGLLGKEFGPNEYRAALEERLGIAIHLEELPDADGGPLAGQLTGSVLAEVVFDEKKGRAIVLVRESLRYKPWPAYELSVFHELSHLAAGHPLRVKRAKEKGSRSSFRAPVVTRLARQGPVTLSNDEEIEELKREVLEPEAGKRATWLVLAGMCPGSFEADKADVLT